MKIRTFKALDAGVCRVSVHTEDWSEGDRQLMARFGQPEIDLGGTITDGSATLAELDPHLVRIVGDSPFTAAFDARDYDNDVEQAKAVANAWADAIAARLAAAIAELRAHIDGFTSETVSEV